MVGGTHSQRYLYTLSRNCEHIMVHGKDELKLQIQLRLPIR